MPDFQQRITCVWLSQDGPVSASEEKAPQTFTVFGTQAELPAMVREKIEERLPHSRTRTFLIADRAGRIELEKLFGGEDHSLEDDHALRLLARFRQLPPAQMRPPLLEPTFVSRFPRFQQDWIAPLAGAVIFGGLLATLFFWR
jgi:hypothetical protein